MVAPVTSGTASFLVSRDDIVKAAMRHMKQLGQGGSVSTEDTTNLAFALNMILKTIAADGYLRHLYQTLSFALQANKQDYTIAEVGADVTNIMPEKIAHGWRRDASSPAQDIPLIGPVSRQEFDLLTPKAAQGYPNTFTYEYQIALSKARFWPVPIDGTQTAFFAIERPVQDILSSGQNFDLPQMWFLPLGWMLADEVVMDFEVDIPTINEITRRAEFWRNKIANATQEDAPIFIQPNMGSYPSKFNS